MGYNYCVIDVVRATFITDNGNSQPTKLLITLAYPYHWQLGITTRSRLIKVIFFCFCLALSLSFGVFLHRHFFTYGTPVIIILTIATVIFTWSWTYKLVARHRKVIQTTQTLSNSQNISRKKILRSTVTALAVIFCLLTCYVLILCLFFLSLNVDRDTQGTLWVTAVALVYLNSLLNPCLAKHFLQRNCGKFLHM